MAGGFLHPLVLSPLVLPQSLLSLLPAVRDGLECAGRTVAWALVEVIGPQPIPPVEMQTLFLPYTENGVYPLLCSVQGERQDMSEAVLLACDLAVTTRAMPLCGLQLRLQL